MPRPARDIFRKYLTADLPLHADDLAEHGGSPERDVEAMIEATVARMYSEQEENRFLEVTYAGGDKEILYFKDFNSGAMIQNVVDRAKKIAIKEFLTTGQRGIRVEHLLASCVDEFKENEDLPNTTNPDDWARISGKKGERIIYVRTLVSTKSGTEPGRTIDTVGNTGQYLCGRAIRQAQGAPGWAREPHPRGLRRGVERRLSRPEVASAPQPARPSARVPL
jgi:proteasome-associated ATPase